MDFSTSKQNFVDTVTPYAKKASSLLGGKIPYQAIVAQWAHESGYGGFTARNTWVKGNNLAGVNVPSGATAKYGTNIFGNLDEFVNAYVRAIGINNPNSTYVKNGLRDATDVKSFASAMGSGGYAMGVKNVPYTNNIIKTYDEIYGQNMQPNTTDNSSTTSPTATTDSNTPTSDTFYNPLDLWGNISRSFMNFWSGFGKVVLYGGLLFLVMWLMFKISNSKELGT